MKFIASVSWGKDSTAMLLMLLENNYPVDEVVFFDTGMEFEEIYKVRDFVIKNYLEPKRIKYTELHPKKPFIYYMLEHEHPTRNGTSKKGYGWCGGLCRWGTTQKTQSINNYCKGNYQYIGIAYDEPDRLTKLSDNPNKVLL